MNKEAKSIEVKQEAPLAEEQTERIRDRRIYTPRADIYETKDELVVVMDVPGVDENSMDIVLDKSVLTINAFPAYERPEKLSLAYAEYGEGDYQRSFALSEEIDRKRIQANVKDGVLYLKLPKADAVKPQKINVKAG